MAAISDMSVPVGPQGSLLVAERYESQCLGLVACGVNRGAHCSSPGQTGRQAANTAILRLRPGLAIHQAIREE